MTAVKVETLIFCPDCLKMMRNGKHPNCFGHINNNENCPVNAVELNGNREIARIHYNEGNGNFTFEVI